MSKSPNVIISVLSTCLVLTLLGCGGAAFEPQFEEAPAPEKAIAIEGVDTPKERTERAVIVGLIDDPKELFAWDMATGETLWSWKVDAKSIPILAGNLVILQENQGVIARHLKSGKEALDLGDDAQIVGADSDGEYTVISLKMGADSNPRGVLVGAKDGRKKWTNDLKLPVGVPAVTNGVAVVPWASHRISLLSAESGNEKVRYQINDALIGQAFIDQGGVFVGHHGVFRLSKRVEAETIEELGYYEPLARQFPNQPPFMRDGYEPLPSQDDDWAHTRLLWRPHVENDTVGLLDDTLYFLHHRFLFALAPDKDELRWLYQSPKKVVGAVAVPGGAKLVTEDGQIVSIDAKTGLVVSMVEMGISGIQVATVRGDEFKRDTDQDSNPISLRMQIETAIDVKEEKLAGGTAFAVRFLRQFKEPEVTGTLVKICSDLSNHPSFRAAACKTLGQRTTGPSHVRDALKKRVSFLNESPAPPSGALTLAAANMSIKGSVKDILNHLWNPATPTSELNGIFEGLGKLGGKQASGACDKFLRLYHAGTSDKRLIDALGKAAEALVAIENKKAKPTLEYIAKDPATPPALKESVSKLSATLEALDEGEKEETKPEKPVEDKREDRITEEMVKKLFKPIEKKLKKCIPENSSKIKFNLLVGPSGEIKSFSTSPDTAKECAAKHLDKKSFPETKKKESERIIYVINR